MPDNMGSVPRICLFGYWLPNVPATCLCISGMDLLRQVYVSQGWICSDKFMYLRDGSAQTSLCISGMDLLRQVYVSQGWICSDKFMYLRDGSAQTSLCISGTDLLRQVYVLLHWEWERSCRSNFSSHPVTVYWHGANQSQCWPYNAMHQAGYLFFFFFSSSSSSLTLG